MEEIRIYFTGFMTSGKSTIGPITANVMGLNFYDLDKEIQKRESLTVTKIFETKGEEYFRKLESKVLEELSDEKMIVISLGGGTIINGNNLELIKKKGILIYIKVSPETLYERLKHKTDRPIFKEMVLNSVDKDDFTDKIKSMLIDREKYYLQADIVIETEKNKFGNNIDLLVKKIKKKLYERNNS